MKMRKELVVMIALAFCAVSLGVGFAQPSGTESAQGAPPPPPPHRIPGLGLLMRCVEQNVTAQVLANLTGQPLETITQEIEEQGPGALIDAYQIDQESFSAALKEALPAVVNQAFTAGLITEAQKTSILQELEQSN